MHISLADEAVLITGGAVRVGRAIALACARAGASVGITYRTSGEQAAVVVREMEAAAPHSEAVGARRFAAFQVDVSVGAEVQRLAEESVETLGKVTVLVNNAAIFRRTPFADMTESDFDDHIGINLKGPYMMSKAFGDIFVGQQRGCIINVADINGLRPLKNYVPYCVSKAGLVMLTEAMAKAVAPNVRVNCVCPGTVLPPSESQGGDEEAEAAAESRIPRGRIGDPEDIAAAVVFLIGGPQHITGAVLPVDGGQRLR